jgi:serine/threonine protein kinase/Tol biopolymer transport system component
VITDGRQVLTAGTRIGPYEIVEWLGAGGMGVVYRATDPRLERPVAIKVISPAFATDRGRIARFEQEARTAGQLNHPNIVTVYDIGMHAGTPFVVSELLEGETLRARLASGALTAQRAVDLARQTALGLAAAHDRRIVHRDVKPENLFITIDGRLKILDFGLVKLTTSDDEPSNSGGSTSTSAGMVVGTAAYMSPEQVRGEAVDPRSDIFSTGAVLHEMLTGRPAFARATSAETMVAILREDPSGPLPSGVSPAVERIVSRCLEKTRDARFQSARDLAFGLEVLSDSYAPAVTAAAGVRRRRPQVAATATVALMLVVAAMAGWLLRERPSPPVDNPLANPTFSRVTDWPGSEGGAEISPDGRFVAFISDRDGPLNLFQTQVGSGRFVNLTSGLPAVTAPGAVLRTIGFSGDSGEIWFTQAGDASAPKSLIPLTGGPPRAFLGQGRAAPSWSPDDSRLVFFTNGGGDPLYIADRTGADAQPLAVTDAEFFRRDHNHNPMWSPDGKWLYFAHGSEPTEEMNVWRVRPSGGTPEPLTALHVAINLLAPIDERTVLFIAREENGSGPWLWSLDVETRAVRRVTSGLEHYSSVSASRDGRRIVVTAANPTATLWSVPLLERVAEESDVTRDPQAPARASAPRFANSSMFYLSDRGAGDGLWRAAGGQAVEVWKAPDDSMTEPPAVSPDGTQVAIVARRDGERRLVVMAADGTDARTLTPSITIRGSGGQGSADWSPDGAWIVAAGSDAEGPGLFRIPVNGGAPVRLLKGPVMNPVWSPAGTLIVYCGAAVGGQVPLLAERPDGTPANFPRVMVRLGGGHRFLRDGSGLVYLARDQSLDFRLLDLATNTTRLLTHLSDQGTLRTFDITPDGRHIVFDRTRENSDIALIDLPKR